MTSIINAFTVDVEDYFHVSAFAERICPTTWGSYESRVVDNTRRILRLLDKHQTRATFFSLGWVAENYPQLVREIHRAGHEIGNHSYWHRLVYDLDPDEFCEDLLQANAVLEDTIGEPVTAFRAPSFSVTENSLWALDVLIEHGFRIDSSIFPIYHDRYGIPHAPRFPHVVRETNSNERLWEFPPSVHRSWGLNLPVSGGGYFRLLPARIARRLLSNVNATTGQPFMFYIHPWELDPGQPRLPGSMRSRVRHYQNLRTTERKLDRLLECFRFGTASESLEHIQRATALA